MNAGTLFRLPLVAVVVLLGACTGEGVYVSDDLDLELQFDTGSPDDELHLPYVQGAQVSLRPGVVDAESDGTAGYQLESSDSGVLAPSGPVDPSTGEQQFEAVAAGTATIRVLDPDGDTVHTAEITVRAPSRAELHPAGPERLRSDEGRVALERAQVLEGGTATFLVRYFDGEDRLYGNGVLAASSDADIVLEPTTSYLFENREWLQISPTTVGLHDVALEAGGVAIGTFAVEAVPASAVADVQLLGEDESGAEDGDSLMVLAQAYDAEGDPIYGAVYQWDVDGVEQMGDGDMYQYSYVAGAPASLGASFGDLHVQAEIHLGEGTVASSTAVGCSVAPGFAGSDALLVPCFLAAALLVARRRRRRSSR